MSLMKIVSANKDLSWVLVKNPESGIATRSIRQGIGYGWFKSSDPSFADEQQYNLFFKDGVDCDSFSKNDFEYLSQGKFGHPLSFMALLTTFLRDVVKGTSENDVETYNKIVLEQVNFRGKRLLEHLQAHLKVDMVFEELNPCVFRVVFSSEKTTLNNLVSNVLISCLFLAGEEGVFLTKLNEDFMKKYADVIKDLDLPYYLRYVFARNYFRSKDQFNKFKGMIEKEGVVLEHGDTGFQRLRFIESKIDHTRSILDVGHGEGMYALNLTKRSSLPYYAVDIDQDLVDSVQAKANARGLDVTTYNHIDKYEDNQPVDLLFTEVIEHLELDEGEELFKKLLNLNFNKLFITTPDKRFNKHYLLGEEEFRHDDHKWEMDDIEFKEWVERVVSESGVDVEMEYFGIGDSVDGVYTSQGFVIQNKNVAKQAIITVGVSGSGKSTFAERVCKTSDNWVEINRDNIRFRNREKNWNTYRFTNENERRVTAKWDKQLYNAIDQGKDLVISDTNNDKDRLQGLINRLEDVGYLVTVKHFDVPFEELLKRDRQRVGGVGYEVLLSQYIKNQRHFKGVEKYTPDESKPQTYIFDIDGTLSDSEGIRSPFDWSKVGEDKPILHTVAMAKGLYAEGYKIVFLSGRDASCKEQTRNWLVEHLGDWVKDCLLCMRPEGSFEKDYVVKMDMFNKYVRHNYNVVAAVDDRKQVIEECWNVLGVPTINVGDPTKRF